jgi:hypothetical protein
MVAVVALYWPGSFSDGVTHPLPTPAYWDALRQGVDNLNGFLSIRKGHAPKSQKCSILLDTI